MCVWEYDVHMHIHMWEHNGCRSMMLVGVLYVWEYGVCGSMICVGV